MTDGPRCLLHVINIQTYRGNTCVPCVRVGASASDRD